MRKIIKGILLLLLIVLLGTIYKYYKQMAVVTSYAARTVCTCTFSGNRSLENIKQYDLDYFPLNQAKFDIDKKTKTVTASVLGLQSTQSVYKGISGCVTIRDNDDFKASYLPKESKPDLFPLKELDESKASLTASLTELLDPYLDNSETKTRTILVMKNDTILYERYGEGLNKDTPQLGWSMTKSITNALIGIATEKKLINVNMTKLFPEWENDPRSRITLQHLLQMNSGLQWEEDYSAISDATEMLFLSEDIVASTKDNLNEFPPTLEWEYSSGSTNQVLGVLRDKLGDEVYHSFPKTELFDKIGMTSAFIEKDESGNFIGSSYGYATARDWAKFGLLYLNDGLRPDSLRVLPVDWVNYTSRPVNSVTRNYGSHWWLNDRNCAFKDVPGDLFYASGFRGQYVFVIPSEDLVVVRLGQSEKLDINTFLSEIIKTINSTD